MSMTVLNLGNRTEVAIAVMNYIDSARTKWVPTIPLMRGLGIQDLKSNRDRLRSTLYAMRDRGLLVMSGDKNYQWALSDYVNENGWNTTDPFATTCPKPAPKVKHAGPYTEGDRVRLLGKTYDWKQALKDLDVDAKWDEELGVWHVDNIVENKRVLERHTMMTSGQVSFHQNDKWDDQPAITEEVVVNRMRELTTPPATNGHANGTGKDHTAELATLRKQIASLTGTADTLANDIKREEDRSAKLAERLTAAEKMLAAQPKTIKVEKYDGTVKVLKNVILPKNFDRILSLAKCRENILLVGPAGCGKSTVAKLIAQTLDLDFSKMGGCEGLTQAHLLGKDRPLANKGEGKYEVSDFVTRFEKGGVICLDEMDAFDPNVFLTLNQALDDGDYLPLPNRPGKPAKKHKDFVCIGTANTRGRGGDRMYVRNQLDAASLDRFAMGIIECGYDENVETAILPNPELRETLWKIRGKVEDAGLRRIVSTRFLAKAHKMTTMGGWKLADVLESLFSGWSKDEKAKCGY